jgi:hypothetical protein
VANKLSAKTGKPAAVFAYKGEDEHGQQLYKLSTRNDARVPHALGELTTYPAMMEACTIKKRNEAGEIVEGPVLGGHTEVASGTVTRENLPRAQAALAASSYQGWYPSPWDGPEAFLSERKVTAERLAAIEEQAVKLAPFGRGKQLVVPGIADRDPVFATHTESRVSVVGRLLLSNETDAENEAWRIGTLKLDDGTSRDVRFPGDTPAPPEDQPCEWLLRLGKPGAYWLRLFHAAKAQAAVSAAAAAESTSDSDRPSST